MEFKFEKNNEFYRCKSETWTQTENDVKVLGHGKLPNGNYAVKMKKGEGLDGNNDVKNTLHSHPGAFFT